MKLTFVCLALTLATSAAAETGAALDEAGFADALEACTVASHQGPHPFMPDFIIHHAIVADTEAGCEYTQSMPGDMQMSCMLSEAGRTALAEEFREYAAGSLSGSSSEPPAWASECEIVTKDGKRIPMHGG